MTREPLLTIASITAVFTAAFALLVAYGFDISKDQQSAILGIVAVVAPLIVGFASRPKVTPVP